VALCRAYIDVAGRVLHHNIDKGLLVAGQSEPALGGHAPEAKHWPLPQHQWVQMVDSRSHVGSGRLCTSFSMP